MLSLCTLLTSATHLSFLQHAADSGFFGVIQRKSVIHDGLIWKWVLYIVVWIFWFWLCFDVVLRETLFRGCSCGLGGNYGSNSTHPSLFCGMLLCNLFVLFRGFLDKGNKKLIWYFFFLLIIDNTSSNLIINFVLDIKKLIWLLILS